MIKVIQKISVLVMVAFLIASCSDVQRNYPEPTASRTMNNVSQASVVFQGMNDYWVRTEKTNLGDRAELMVFMPVGESFNSWVEKISVKRFTSHVKVSPYGYYEQILTPEIKDACYYVDPHLVVIKQEPSSLVYSYKMKNCGKSADQFVVGKVLRSANNVNVIEYAAKEAILTDGYIRYMIKLISNAKLVNTA